jgi:hypothetical protein
VLRLKACETDIFNWQTIYETRERVRLCACRRAAYSLPNSTIAEPVIYIFNPRGEPEVYHIRSVLVAAECSFSRVSSPLYKFFTPISTGR